MLVVDVSELFSVVPPDLVGVARVSLKIGIDVLVIGLLLEGKPRGCGFLAGVAELRRHNGIITNNHQFILNYIRPGILAEIKSRR